jgi:hypothetical protein
LKAGAGCCQDADPLGIVGGRSGGGGGRGTNFGLSGGSSIRIFNPPVPREVSWRFFAESRRWCICGLLVQ